MGGLCGRAGLASVSRGSARRHSNGQQALHARQPPSLGPLGRKSTAPTFRTVLAECSLRMWPDLLWLLCKHKLYLQGAVAPGRHSHTRPEKKWT
jgi:hypothetical protein